MVRTARIAGLAVALCVCAAAPARADFMPDLTLGLEPPTASTAPALTATISQPVKDSPVERFTLNLPAGFELLGAPGAAVCSPVAMRAAACPAASRIGSVDGRIGASTGVSGALYKAGSDRFAAIVSALGGSIGQVVPGSISRRADGSLDLKLDQLPALALTRLTFSFDGGQHSLVRTPARCGAYDVDGKFTSRAGEFALDRTTVAVTGCSGVPAVQVANVRLSRTSFRAGAYRTIIAWWASRAVDHTNVRVERHVKGRWRVIGVLVANANAGDNIMRWDGRLRERALHRGTYGLRIQPAGSAPSRIVRFRVL
jgi:hypothetical protein